MSMLQRAAQFSPFAALNGYEEALKETARLTVEPVELAEDGAAMLDEKLRRVIREGDKRPEIAIVYFQPDERKSGGAYLTATGRLKRYDSHAACLILEDGRNICVERIVDLEQLSEEEFL
jgi:hypothetical protein